DRRKEQDDERQEIVQREIQRYESQRRLMKKTNLEKLEKAHEFYFNELRYQVKALMERAGDAQAIVQKYSNYVVMADMDLKDSTTLEEATRTAGNLVAVIRSTEQLVIYNYFRLGQFLYKYQQRFEHDIKRIWRG